MEAQCGGTAFGGRAEDVEIFGVDVGSGSFLFVGSWKLGAIFPSFVGRLYLKFGGFGFGHNTGRADTTFV